MLAALVLALVAAAKPEVSAAETARLHRFFPCTPGLAVTYEVEPKIDPSKPKVRFTDVVRGPGKAPNTCTLERVTSKNGRDVKELWARELLADRVSHMGWADQPLALRPPLLVLPIEPKKRWSFNTTRYELEAVDVTVDTPAGRFEGAVKVHERSLDGTWEATSTYAPDVGLLVFESKETIQRAVKIERPKAEPRDRGATRKSAAPTR